MLKAAVDVGTNTSRLLIAEEHDGKITPVLVKRRITRLGGGFSEQTGLAEDAVERTVEALAEFAADITASGAQRVRAVATSAVRDAANGVAFRDRVQKETGIGLEIIEGSEEGFLTLRGALAGIDDPTGMFMVFDVGGGSTEYTVSEGSSLLFSRSLPLGVVRLTEGKKSVENMKEKIRREIAFLQAEMVKLGTVVNPAVVTLVATAGTATTVAAIDLKLDTYDYRLVNNHVLTLDRIREIYNMLLSLPAEERLAVPGLEKGREDLIIAGMLIMIHTMESWGFKTLKVNDFGLLEGVLLSA